MYSNRVKTQQPSLPVFALLVFRICPVPKAEHLQSQALGRPDSLPSSQKKNTWLVVDLGPGLRPGSGPPGGRGAAGFRTKFSIGRGKWIGVGAGGRRGLSKGLERPPDLVLGSGPWDAERRWEEHGLQNPSPALGGGVGTRGPE